MRYLVLLAFLTSSFAHAGRFDRLIDSIAARARSGSVGGVRVTAHRRTPPRSGQLGLVTILSANRSATGFRFAPELRINVGGGPRGERRLIFAYYSQPLQARAAAQADRIEQRIHAVLDSHGVRTDGPGVRRSGLFGTAPLTSHREDVEITLTQTEAVKLDLGAIEEIVQVVVRTR